MRAVNLIPAEERRSQGFALSTLNPVTLGLLGGLLLALLAVTATVLVSNTTNDRRAEASRIEAQAAAVNRKTAALGPDLAQREARERSAAAVQNLAGTRYDWSKLLGSVSFRLPRDVRLTSFNGSLGGDSGASAAASTGAPPAGGTVALTGCAQTLRSIARLMEGMRAIDGVQDVTFSSSSRSASGESSACPFPRSFQLTIALASQTVNAAGGTS